MNIKTWRIFLTFIWAQIDMTYRDISFKELDHGSRGNRILTGMFFKFQIFLFSTKFF